MAGCTNAHDLSVLTWLINTLVKGRTPIREDVTGWQKMGLAEDGAARRLPSAAAPPATLPAVSEVGGWKRPREGPPTSDSASEAVSGFRRPSPGVGVLPLSPLCPTLSACSHFCRASSNSSMPERGWGRWGKGVRYPVGRAAGRLIMSFQSGGQKSQAAGGPWMGKGRTT